MRTETTHPRGSEHGQQQAALLADLVDLFRRPDAEFALYRQEHEHGRDQEQLKRCPHPRLILYHGIRAYDPERIRQELRHALGGGQAFRIDASQIGRLGCYGFAQGDHAWLDLLQRRSWDLRALLAWTQQQGADAWAMAYLVYTLLVTEMLEVEGALSAPRVAEPAPVGPSKVPSSGRWAMVGTPTQWPPTRTTSRPATAPVAPPAPVPIAARTTARPGSAPLASAATTRPPTPPVVPRTSSAVGKAAALSPEAHALGKQLSEMAASLESRDHFELLGVARDASTDVVKRAYFAMAKQFHPDRVGSFGLEELRSDAERIFARLSEAHAVLCDEARRRGYLESLARAASGEADKVKEILDAEQAFRAGEVALRRRDFESAEDLFRQSVQKNPEEGEHHALLGWAIYQNPKHPREAALAAAIKKMERAITLSPKNPRARYLLGEIFLAEQQVEKAIVQFRRTLELCEKHPEAERGLRLALSRKGKSTQPKTMLRRLGG